MILIIKENVSNSLKNFQGLIDEELFEKVKTVNIFARVYPNHKMRIVNALQKDNKIVAMTGDGINDAPALKKANIGIAMGQRGINVAKESADLILLDDNFNTIVKTIENGRTIYKNIRKAISYIISIHIPIALLSLFIPLFKLPTLLLSTHVMLLELLIDPTASIIFQRIKSSKNIMKENLRNIKEPILNFKDKVSTIVTSGIILGLLAFIYLPFYNKVANTLPLDIKWWLLIIFLVLISVKHFDILKIKRNKK